MLHGATLHGLEYIKTTLLGEGRRGSPSSTSELLYVLPSLYGLRPYVYLCRPSGEHLANIVRAGVG